MNFFKSLLRPGDVFKPGRDVVSYLVVVLCFGLACGCFFGVMNNFLAEEVGVRVDGRGRLEFFREMPGLLLMVILALFAKRDEWWILRVGLVIAMAGMAGLFFAPPHIVAAGFFIVMWSLGEHLLMPVRSSITMHLAKPGQEGGAMGIAGGLGSLGTVAGSGVVVGIFLLVKKFGWMNRAGFDASFVFTFALLLAALCATFFVKGKGGHVKRPRLHFDRKFNKFYILEVFYGARKQVFITFAPFMLITIYGFDTARLAFLGLVCALANIFCAPVAGWIVDKLGYRTVLIWDTVFLAVVCLLYGFADKLFPFEIALAVVYANFILDAVITNASMATNVYVRGIASSREEVTATLSTGISVNHLISIIVALAGGALVVFVADKTGSKSVGYGVLFSFSALMALLNTLFALTIPKPVKKAA